MIDWNPALKAKADALTESLSDISDYTEFVLEVQNQAAERLNDLIEGLSKYTDLPTPDIGTTKHKTIWREGTTSLFDYGISSSPNPSSLQERGKDSVPAPSRGRQRGGEVKVLFVPSLINKSYILDLTKDSSLIKFLKDKGFHPYMIDWGQPREEEKEFSLDDYIERINKAISQVGDDIILVGYCMGGLMALASALQDQDKLKGLVLLATPWDFHSDDSENILFRSADIESFRSLLDTLNLVPKELIYLMFYFMDPWPVHSKYRTPKNSEEFLSREHWVHDGVEMVSKVAKDVFIDWSYYNTPAEGKWKVFDKLIDPRKVKIPTFIGFPTYDRVVPPLSAKPLTELIKDATIVSSPSGHVGMIVGKNAKEYLWNPLAKWLDSL